MGISRIELGLENCEVINLDATDVSVVEIRNDKSVLQFARSLSEAELVPALFISNFMLKVNNQKLAEPHDTGWEGDIARETIGERLQHGDITQIYLWDNNRIKNAYNIEWGDEDNPNYNEASFFERGKYQTCLGANREDFEEEIEYAKNF